MRPRGPIPTPTQAPASTLVGGGGEDSRNGRSQEVNVTHSYFCLGLQGNLMFPGGGTTRRRCRRIAVSLKPIWVSKHQEEGEAKSIHHSDGSHLLLSHLHTPSLFSRPPVTRLTPLQMGSHVTSAVSHLPSSYTPL